MSPLKDKNLKIVIISAVVVLAIIVSILGYFVIDILIDIFKPVENGITIVSDEDFLNYDFTGSGSPDDPYVIANYVFSEKFIGISISNTTRHFIITNCTITDFYIGVQIENILFGTCKIFNNSIIEGWWPEVGPYHNIKIHSSDGVVVNGNNLNFGGLEGVTITGSNNCTIEKNNISYCLTGISLTDCMYTNVTSNIITGHPLDGMIISNSENTIIERNRIEENDGDGITIRESSFSLIKSNEIIQEEDSLHSSIGINVYLSNNVTYLGNTIQFFREGIRFIDVDFCNITLNEFQNNSYYAISFDELSQNNIISMNSFIDNSVENNSQGFDDGLYNLWYNAATSSGNFWSTWSGIGDYEIDGSTESVDIYPLALPPVF